MTLPRWMKSSFFNNKKYLSRKRFYMQFGFAILLNMSFAATGFFALHWVCAPVINCWACPYAVFGCPVGILANLAALNLIALGAIGVIISTGVAIGRWTCGWVCPFGWFQELLYMIPTPKLALPRVMLYLKYVALALMVFLIPWFVGGGTVQYDDIKPLKDTASIEITEDQDGEADDDALMRFLSRKMFFCYYCPAGTLQASLPLALSEFSVKTHQGRIDKWRENEIRKDGLDPENLTADEEAEYPRLEVERLDLTGVVDKLVVLGFFLLAFVFLKRPFCRAFCPAGAALAAFSKVSLLRLKVDMNKCVRCNACTNRCPQGIAIYKPDAPISECILCNECVVICPVKAISYENPFKLKEPLEVVKDKVKLKTDSDKG
ncbi:MAG: 4Fe-4S binding protein [Planctomycetota bacterium]